MQNKIAIVGEAWGEDPYKLILLPSGVHTIVDAYMLAFLEEYSWCEVRRSDSLSHVMTKIRGRTIFLHHVIIGIPLGGRVVDHINGNGLDNRKINLRVVTQSQNMTNTARSRNASNIEKHGNRWRVRPYLNGKRINIGSFSSKEEAEKAVEKFKNARENSYSW